MRAALPLACMLLAAALLPGLVHAAEGHGGHGAEGPATPMVKSVTLFLDGAGALVTAPAAAGAVPAAPANVNGESAPTAWEIAATKRTIIDSSIYVELYATTTGPSIVAGGPEGAAFEIQLTHNGEPVEGAVSTQKLPSTLVQAGQSHRMKLFLPQPDLTVAPGDTLGLQVRYFGLNPEGSPAVQYDVGGEQGSRMVFRLRMASFDQLDVPKEVGSWPVAPSEGFDFAAAQKANPTAKVVTLKAHHWGFQGAPVVVPNGTRLILQLTIDESFAEPSTESHESGAEAPPAAAWDENLLTATHGFSLASLDPRLSTVLVDGLVITMAFDAIGSGNHTFICTVFCGSGHGRMLNRLTIEGPQADQPLNPQQSADPAKGAPGFEGLALLAALGIAGVVARRRWG